MKFCEIWIWIQLEQARQLKDVKIRIHSLLCLIFGLIIFNESYLLLRSFRHKAEAGNFQQDAHGIKDESQPLRNNSAEVEWRR